MWEEICWFPCFTDESAGGYWGYKAILPIWMTFYYRRRKDEIISTVHQNSLALMLTVWRQSDWRPRSQLIFKSRYTFVHTAGKKCDSGWKAFAWAKSILWITVTRQAGTAISSFSSSWETLHWTHFLLDSHFVGLKHLQWNANSNVND